MWEECNERKKALFYLQWKVKGRQELHNSTNARDASNVDESSKRRILTLNNFKSKEKQQKGFLFISKKEYKNYKRSVSRTLANSLDIEFCNNN